MLVDTHTHLNFKAFEKDWGKVAEDALKAGVEKMIVVGTDLELSQKAVEIVKKHEALFAAVGVHPHHARGIDNENLIDDLRNELEKLARHKKVVAIGEVGLDYHIYRNSKYEINKNKDEWKKLKNLQKKLFGMQIEVAKKLGKPLIIHSREAKREVLDVLEHFSKSDGKMPKGVFHCFEGRKTYLKKILEAGFFVGFTGHIVNKTDRHETAKLVPLERLLLETDCPYIKVRLKSLRSTPGDVKILAQVHAKMRGINLSKVEAQTSENAKVLFGI